MAPTFVNEAPAHGPVLVRGGPFGPYVLAADATDARTAAAVWPGIPVFSPREIAELGKHDAAGVTASVRAKLALGGTILRVTTHAEEQDAAA